MNHKEKEVKGSMSNLFNWAAREIFSESSLKNLITELDSLITITTDYVNKKT